MTNVTSSPRHAGAPLRLLLGCAIAVLALPAAADVQRTEYSAVDLVAEQASLPTSGGTVTLGLHLQPNPTWHAYWSNPGDAGKEASIRWSLPEGFEAEPLQFPAPHLIPFGEFNTYGFEEAVLLLADVAVPPGLDLGRRYELAGRASWVVCDDALCVPERADIALTLTAGDGGADPANADRFAAARAKLPTVVDWPARFTVADDQVHFDVDAPAGSVFNSPYLFVEAKRLVAYASQTSASEGGALRLSMPAGRRADVIDETKAVLHYVDGSADAQDVLLAFSRGQGQAAGAGTAAAPAASGDVAAPIQGPSPNSAGGFAAFVKALVFGLLGGIVLNLMPCVFPILSMKALGLVNLSAADRRTAQASGLFYTAGILVAFAIAALALIALREAGRAVGWGFQLQSPLVNVALGLGMVAIGLNLAGVYEIGTRLMGLGQSLTAGEAGNERRTAFFTGLLAVVVATPCTAPFMAGALGYALAQPAAVALAVFLALGLGLALPYLALGFVPALGRVLPKPGPWMAHFRRVLAFPMFATALWLFWVVGRQSGATAMAVALLAALLLAFALWAVGQGSAARRPLGWRIAAVAGLLACVVAGVRVDGLGEDQRLAAASSPESAGTLGKLELERFSPERVTDYIASGQPVFVYFTADWCVSCKVNERVALATDAVGDAFNARGIAVVEGDWTAEDPVITEWLEKYDRAGVPLYLYFPSGSSLATATVLPQVLLPGIVIDVIEGADLDVADFARVQAYLDADAAWHALADEIRDSDADADEKERRREEELGEHPAIDAAVAAARAILAQGDAHDRLIDAAVFLAEHTAGRDDTEELMLLGASTLESRAPEHEDWPILLRQIDFYVAPDANDDVEQLFERLASGAPVATHRAAARYYQASRLMRRADDLATDADARQRYRSEALALAEGLSAGVEDEVFVKSRNSKRPPMTVRQAEEDFIYTFNFVSVGGTLPDVVGTRLDGSDASLSEYGDQVVLLDFWATWCPPCVGSLPDLRDLAASMPADRFELLSISVDAERDTVTEFQADEPMPWSNWHIGPDSEILKTWVIRGYPTYLLIDADGRVLARTHKFDEQLVALIEHSVADAPPSA